jgi:NADH-quinone oxidoreductase subunit E
MSGTGSSQQITPLEAKHALDETRAILRGFPPGKRGNLIPALQAVQERLGYLPRPAVLEIAVYLNVSPVEAYEVVTFYNQFRQNPPGRHSIRVCLGTACHMKGGYITLDAWQRRLEVKSG